MEEVKERQAADGTYYKKVGDKKWQPIIREAADGTLFKKVGDKQWSPMETPEQANSEMSLTDRILSGIGVAAKAIESYTGAPTRAAIVAGSKGESPLSAFYQQMGKPPETAPSGKDVNVAIGIPDKKISTYAGFNPTPFGGPIIKPETKADVNLAETLNVPTEMAADVLNVLPFGALTKGAVKAGERGAQLLKIPEAISLAGKGAAVSMEALGAGAAKVGEALTGVPANEIRNYAARTKEITDIMKQAGDDWIAAADQVRDGISKSIQGFKSEMNNTISNALKTASDEKFVPAEMITKKLEDFMDTRLDPVFQREEFDKIQEVIDLINEKAAEGSGMLSMADVHSTKQYLQRLATRSYTKGDVFFEKGPIVARAAKKAAAEAKIILDKISPEIKEANEQLAKLHEIEDNMSKAILRKGAAEGTLVAAGRGGARSGYLQQLEDLTGMQVVQPALDLGTAKRFADAPILPIDSTGKSVLRTGLAYMIGGPQMGVLTAALSSPVVLKKAIEAGQLPVNLIYNALGGAYRLTDDAFKQAVNVLKSDEGASIIDATLRGAKLYPDDENQNIKPAYRSERGK